MAFPIHISVPRNFYVPVFCVVLAIAVQAGAVYLHDKPTGFFIAVFAVFLFILAAFWRPVVFLYLLAFVFPYQSFILADTRIASFGAMVPYWPIDVMAFITFAALFIRMRWLKPEGAEGVSPYHLSIFLLLSWAALSLYWSIDFNLGVSGLVKLAVCAVVFYAPVYFIKNKGQLKKVVFVLFLAGIPMAIAGILSPYIGAKNLIDTTLYEQDLAYGFVFKLLYFAPQHKRATGFAYPNFLSIFMAISFISGLYLIARTRNWLSRLLVFAVMMLFLYGQIHSLSKAGLVAFFGGVLFFALVSPVTRERWPRYWVLLSGMALLALFIFSMVKLGGGIGRFSKGLTSSKLASSSGARIYIWKKGLKLFMETYGLGIGVGGMIPATSLHLHTHNAFMGVLYELGFIGLSAYAFLQYSIVSQARRVRALAKGEYGEIMAAFAGMLAAWTLHSLIEFDYYLLRVPWFVMGLAVATMNLKSRDDKEGVLTDGTPLPQP